MNTCLFLIHYILDLTCVGLLCDPAFPRADSSPGAAPEPAGGIQTPGTDGPPSPAAACVAAPTIALPRWSCGPSVRLRCPAPERPAPCRGRGLGSVPGWSGGTGPTGVGGLQAALVWAWEGGALWFCLQSNN